MGGAALITYEYDCTQCNNRFDVVKSVRQMDAQEFCPQCKSLARRIFIPQNVFFNKTKVEHAAYNPGLGCVVKNERHKKEILSQRGLVEVGNECPKRLRSNYEKQLEEKKEKRWDQAFNEAKDLAASPGALKDSVREDNHG